jgi:formamidopyrimidine-DNA glycosylase
MPELPEVETMKRYLEQLLNKNSILHSIKAINDSSLIIDNNLTLDSVNEQKILSIKRQGKYLIFELGNHLYVTVHFRMSGSFFLRESPLSIDTHDRILFIFNNFVLAFHDTRKFGRVTITSSILPLLKKVGYDALCETLDIPLFHTLVTQHSQMIKSFLLDQSHICGLGNIYVDEILFASKIHPQRRCNTLSSPETTLIFSKMREILTKSITMRGTSLGDGDGNFQSEGRRGSYQHYLQIFQRKGEKCIRCGSQITTLKVGGRTTHICSSCQQL